jgi:glucokinase
VLAWAGHKLGVALASAVNLLDIRKVVVGGGVSAAGELLLAPAREEAARYLLPGVGTRTEIRRARYGPLAGVRGAALLAGQELETELEDSAREAAAR